VGKGGGARSARDGEGRVLVGRKWGREAAGVGEGARGTRLEDGGSAEQRKHGLAGRRWGREAARARRRELGKGGGDGW
jgi:hypothetical protein